jgi:myo-inositol 2-dehydrogenase / D-chiro-inositol 1-dehydrogenase
VPAVSLTRWAMNDVPPLKALAVGGRQIPSRGGNIFDHFEVNYEYATGARGFIGCRQIPGCANNNSATIFGTKGRGYELGFGGMPHIKGENEWAYKGPRPDMYQIEHNELFASIRAGKPINDGVRLAHSTLTAIMGRMAAYTGQEVTWDMALNSKQMMVPADLTWDTALPIAPIPKPGETQFI